MAAKKEVAQLNTEVFKASTEVVALSEQLEAVVGHNPITHAFKLANIIAAVGQWVAHPEVAKLMEQLENSPAGFVTDKTGDLKYPPKIRNQCITDALTQGVRVTGNEFNIIAEKAMIVQAGWRRLCQEMGQDIPGGFSRNSNFEMVWMDVYEVGEPKITANMVSISMEISYKWNNKSTGEQETGIFQKNITLTIKSRDTVDAWIGKAERRILRAFYRRYSGVAISDENTAGEFSGREKPAMEDLPPLENKRTTRAKKPKGKPKPIKVGQPAGETFERPTTSTREYEDAEYKESTPEMNDALDDLVGGSAPDAPPEPPTQTDMSAPEPPPARVPTPQEAESTPKSNRPKTNF